MEQSSARRRTKIVATLGPATSSPEKIAALVAAGVDVVRLNFSHGEREQHRGTIRLVREVAAKAGREIGVLQDLGGPKIRLGQLPEEGVELLREERVLLAAGSQYEDGALPVSYPYLAEDVAPGDPILLADGLVELRVIERREATVVCEVVVGGDVTSHKGINLPGTRLRVPAFTDKDRLDLEVGLDEGVDFVALSFVRSEHDLDPVLQRLSKAPVRPMLIAKIEKPQAVERLEEILEQVDGVMVARGDLGVEVPVEQVPLIQKRIIHAAVSRAKPVITATQMLRSMVDNPRPTRAEASDVANAVLDGTDAVMLSEETAVGAYPVEAVRILDRVARAVEPALDHDGFLARLKQPPLRRTDEAIGHAACWLARDIGATAIVASTISGTTARLVARFRPAAPVVGLTPHRAVERQLTLSWGVLPGHVKAFAGTDAMFELAREWALEHHLAAAGDRIILTAGVPINEPGTTNVLRVLEVEG
ncbi:MAG: pyruvate kinase [Acidobacteria bacterium]|jgi:pyruvate kinase|nr:pyruvate kinase [Acidobacteriota bacterium]